MSQHVVFEDALSGLRSYKSLFLFLYLSVEDCLFHECHDFSPYAVSFMELFLPVWKGEKSSFFLRRNRSALYRGRCLFLL